MRPRLKAAIAALFFALHLAAPGAARAADRDPLDYPLKQYAFLLGVALLGGLVSWITKVRKGQAQPWNLMALTGELFTSAFAGLLMFWMCAAADVSPLITAGLVGIAGHMGTRAITELEKFAERRMNPFGSASANPPPAAPVPPEQGPTP